MQYKYKKFLSLASLSFLTIAGVSTTLNSNHVAAKTTTKKQVVFNEQKEQELIFEIKAFSRLLIARDNASNEVQKLNLTKEQKNDFLDKIKNEENIYELNIIVNNANEVSSATTLQQNNEASHLTEELEKNPTEENLKLAKDSVNSLYDTKQKEILSSRVTNIENSINAKKQEEEKARKEAESRKNSNNVASKEVSNHEAVQFGSDGLLVMKESAKGQKVINLLLGIPGHSNGASYHKSTGLDDLIDTLSTPEALWVLHRIEGKGFGQTASGYAGIDTPQSHQTLVKEQLNKRFGDSIHSLLKAWGTYVEYGGY